MLNSKDTSSHKKYENSILQFKQVLDVMVPEVYIFSAETLEFIYVNQSAIDRRGMSEDELLGKTPLDFSSEGNISRAQKRLKPLLDGSCDSLQYESIDYYQSGEKMYADVSLQYVDDPDGKGRNLISVVSDVTKRKTAEIELQQFKATLDNTDTLVHMFWADTLEFFYVNQAAKRIVGRESTDFSGKTPAFVNPDFEENAFRKKLEPLLSGARKTITYETHHLNESGGFVPIEVRMQYIELEGERPRMIAISEDISERKVAEHEISKFQNTLDLTHDEVYMFSVDSLEFFYANQAVADQIGYFPEELFKMKPFDIIPGIKEEPFREMIMPLYVGAQPSITFQTKHRHKSGTLIPVEINLQLIEAEGEKPHFVSIVRNISERRAADLQKLQFKATLDHIEDPVYMFWPDTLKFFYANQAAMNIIGRSAEEFTKMTPADLNPNFDVAAFRMRCKPLVFGVENSITYETEEMNRNGELVPYEAMLQIIEPEDEAPMFVAILRDISERKEVERTKSEFVATVSHELRTPLTSIKGALELVKSGAIANQPERTSWLLDIAYDKCEELTRLVDDILDIQNVETGMMELELAPINIADLIKDAIDTNQNYAIAHNVKLKAVGEIIPVMIDGDKARLMQVMDNLLSNAIKFSDDDTVVEITQELRSEAVRVSIRDHGSGVPKDLQSTIFLKFTRADTSDRRETGGAGLGLSIAKSIINAHRGLMDFTSTEGEGSTFYFELKRSEP